MFKHRVAPVVIPAMVALVAGAGVAQAGTTPEGLVPDRVVTVGTVLVAESLGIETPAELEAYIRSDAEKALLIDAPTGDVISVVPQREAQLIPSLAAYDQNAGA
jgi:hypothetical protein